MKYSTVLVAIFATAVAAGAIEQRGDKDKPPKCAKKCIKEHYKVSGCDKKDMKCMCSSEPFHKAVVPCIKDRCGKGELYVSPLLPSPPAPPTLTTSLCTARTWPSGFRGPAASPLRARRAASSKRLERRHLASLPPPRDARSGVTFFGAVGASLPYFPAWSGGLVFLGVEGRLLSHERAGFLGECQCYGV